MSETEVLHIGDIVAMDTTDIKTEERDEIITALQNHMITSVNYAYSQIPTKDEEHICCEYEEKGLELVSYRGRKKSWMLGTRSNTCLEYISCSKVPMDFKYTIKGENEGKKSIVFNYHDHPSIVFENALKIFSIYHEFFSERKV